MALKEMLKPMLDENDKPGLLVTEDCRGLIENLPAIQHDEKNPSDCATEPHSITHICDAIRYFAVTRTLGAERTEDYEEPEFEDEAVDYDEEMTGGAMTEDYMAYGSA